MMSQKNIIIIGGGISGLALLHYLKIKYYFRNDVSITLLEKNDYLGGTIRSLSHKEYLFETGPNGFLDSKPRTLDFIQELGLEGSFVRASDDAKIRYISVNNTLHALPSNPKEFLKFKLLNPWQKLRILGEMIAPRGKNFKETAYDFGMRRLGQRFSEIFLDPMVSGVYGGDARRTVVSAAFPRIYELEQEYGSLIKAMLYLKKKKKASGGGMPKGTLTSFNGGMSVVINTLGQRYKGHIQLQQDIQTVSRRDDQYIIYSGTTQYVADELFLCTPAYVTGDLIKNLDQELADDLRKITYAPMAVVGLVFSKEAFAQCPKGFGYLIPSLEKNEVLGVLFDSNIFPHRCPDHQIMLRIMMGGVRHPDILRKSKEDLTQVAIKEVSTQFKVTKKPDETFFTSWTNAIPQYDAQYVDIMNRMDKKLEKMAHFEIVANYRGGVSFNDCIESAYQKAQEFEH